MSKKTVKEVRYATRIAGGSTLTKDGRSTALEKFFRVMNKELNLQVKSFTTLKASQVKTYINHQSESGNTHRSIQNQLGHIRQALRAANRGHFADSGPMSNKAMGVAGATRDGTHRPLTQLQYQAVLAAKRATNPGAACCMELQRELGLRAREAIQSPPSLKAWAQALKNRMPGEIIHGTKGGRKRWMAELNHERALHAVETANLVAQAQGGQLIVAKNLKAAARAYCRACANVGLKGEYASHSLRCTYALDRYQMYIELHGDRREALASVSVDLGHGDGRGTYVAQVYLKNPPRELPLI